MIASADNLVERWAAEMRRMPPLDATAHILSALADRSKLWVGIATLRTLVEPGHDWRPALRALAVIAAQSALIHFVVKPAFDRSRPVVEVRRRFGMRQPPSRSFPSGHAASAMTGAILLGDGRRGWTGPLVVLALAVSASRIVVGLHHTTDVAGGVLAGFVTGLVVRRVVGLR